MRAGSAPPPEPRSRHHIGLDVTVRAGQPGPACRRSGVSTLRLPVRGQSQVIAEPAERRQASWRNGLQFLRSIPNRGRGLRSPLSTAILARREPHWQ